MNICHMRTRRLEQLRCAPPFFPAKARPALPSATHDGPRVVGEWKEGSLAPWAQAKVSIRTQPITIKAPKNEIN